jgi:hypothetical protein
MHGDRARRSTGCKEPWIAHLNRPRGADGALPNPRRTNPRSPSSRHFPPARLWSNPPTYRRRRPSPRPDEPDAASSAVTPRSPTPPSSGAGRQRGRRRPTRGHGGSQTTTAACWRRTAATVFHVELTRRPWYPPHLLCSPIPTSPRQVSQFHLVTAPAESVGFLVRRRRRRQGRPRPPGGARPHQFGVIRSCSWVSGRTHKWEEGDAWEMPGYRPPKGLPHLRPMCYSPTIDWYGCKLVCLQLASFHAAVFQQ